MVARTPDATYPGVATTEFLYAPNAANQYATTALNGASAVAQTYDDDGNMTLGRTFLTSNGEFTWDAENRLIQSKVTTGGTALLYSYDAMGRRIAKRIYSSTGTLTAATLYCYDGWNLIGEYNLSGGAWGVARTYTWGLDLSGSMQGAGGIGGLLAVTVATGGSTTGPTGVFYPIYDGNGNVEAYLTSTGGFQAIYQYDAFGSAQAGATAISSTNQVHFFHRFSTKYQDERSKLLYYGYGYYDPYLGRWPSRDPIEERGGLNLYGFLGNNSIGNFDSLGLADWVHLQSPYKHAKDFDEVWDILWNLGKIHSRALATENGHVDGGGEVESFVTVTLPGILNGGSCYCVVVNIALIVRELVWLTHLMPGMWRLEMAPIIKPSSF